MNAPMIPAIKTAETVIRLADALEQAQRLALREWEQLKDGMPPGSYPHWLHYISVAAAGAVLDMVADDYVAVLDEARNRRKAVA